MCEFIENNNKCCKKNVFGNYCNKHKRNHLIKDDFIIFNNFTNKNSDYLKNDIVNTINKIDNKKYNKSLKKDILFNILLERYNEHKYYSDKIKYIQNIQYKFKYKFNKRNILLRGEGFMNRDKCNNKEDFFTYETVHEIDNKYFFSFKDEKNIIWFFDIRSFKKIIEMNQSNPYTMVPIDLQTRVRAFKLIEILKNNDISLDFEDEMKELKKDKKQILKQKIVDVSAAIERLGFSFNLEWFSCLGLIHLKKLYGLMEDIWNYRTQLPIEIKRIICPPNGLIFNKSVIEIRRINSRDDMRNILVTDILKFNDAIDDSDKKTGFMYFLIGLAKINPSVYNIHPWILNID